MGTPREIHSTEAATGHPPVWNEWMTFSDDPSGLVGVDGLEFRVRAEAKVMGRSMDAPDLLTDSPIICIELQIQFDYNVNYAGF